MGQRARGPGSFPYHLVSTASQFPNSAIILIAPHQTDYPKFSGAQKYCTARVTLLHSRPVVSPPVPARALHPVEAQSSGVLFSTHMNISAPEAIEASKQAILSDPAKFRAHMDTLENGLKAEIVEHIPQWFTDYTASVESSNDPDVKMRHIKQMLDFVGWGSSAKRVENPQDKLPVFNFVLNGGSLQVSTIRDDSTERVDVFSIDCVVPTPQMIVDAAINDDLRDIDV